MKTRPFAKHTAVAGLVAGLALAGIVIAQPGPPSDRGPMGPMQGHMMHQHQSQDMMGHMKEIDDKLLKQVENLKGATTEAKVDLLTEIVTTLVQARADMHAQMRMMNPGMSPDQIMNAERMQSMAGMPCVEGKKGDATTE